MKRSTLGILKKTSTYLKKESKRKYVSLDMVSKNLGVYPDVLADELSFINPVLLMDPGVNMKDLLAPIENAILDEENKKRDNTTPRIEGVTKKELASYPTISSFAYAKLTNAGGLIDATMDLNDHDLRVLKKLVEREIAARRKEKRLNKKK